jgi:hypothetical protein
MHRCLGDNCKVVHRQTITMEIKNRTVQSGVCYPSRLAGMNGGQFRSQKPEARSEKSDTEVQK